MLHDIHVGRLLSALPTHQGRERVREPGDDERLVVVLAHALAGVGPEGVVVQQVLGLLHRAGVLGAEEGKEKNIQNLYLILFSAMV